MLREKHNIKKVCKDPNDKVRKTFIRKKKNTKQTKPGLICLCSLICVRVLSNDRMDSIFMEEKYTQL